MVSKYYPQFSVSELAPELLIGTKDIFSFRDPPNSISTVIKLHKQTSIYELVPSPRSRQPEERSSLDLECPQHSIFELVEEEWNHESPRLLKLARLSGIYTPVSIDRPTAFEERCTQRLGYDERNILKDFRPLCIEIKKQIQQGKRVLLQRNPEEHGAESSDFDALEGASRVYAVAMAYLIYRFGKIERFEYRLWQLRTKLNKRFNICGPLKEHEEQLRVWEGMVMVRNWSFAEDTIYRGWVADRQAGREWRGGGSERHDHGEKKRLCCFLM